MGWGVVGPGRGGRLWAAAGGLGGGWRAVGCVRLAGFGWAFFSLVETLIGFLSSCSGISDLSNNFFAAGNKVA